MSRRDQTVERIQRPAADCADDVHAQWVAQTLAKIDNPDARLAFLESERLRLLTQLWRDGDYDA